MSDTTPWNVRRILTVPALVVTLILSLVPVTRTSAQETPTPGVTPALSSRAEMSDRLAAEFAASVGPVNFLVILADQVDVASLAQAASGATPERAQAVYSTLSRHARASQAGLRSWLDAQGVPYRPYYIVNMLEVTGDAALAEALRLRPEVARLAANPPLAAVEPALRREAAASEAAALPWGLDYSGAPAVWAQGITGTGIVVGSQDTGVDWEHPALRAAYRGWNGATADHLYNWFDAFGADDVRASRCLGAAVTDAQIPCDDYGHGTHTVGTMVGDARTDGGTILGMAPGAQWIGCRNMSAGVGTPGSYAACFQFMLAPYPQNGDPFTDGKPELAAHIINNSWGCPPSEGCDDPNILRQVIETARAAGQFVAASAGNEGASCGILSNPIAIYDDVFTVGSHGPSGGISYFSSRGPVMIDGSYRLKPDIVAPGESVYSSYPYGGYGYSQGTSMASPHVAGAVALLWSADPALVGDVETTELILRKSATSVLSSSCGDGRPASPNAVYGYGRLNVAAALELVQSAPSLTVTVVATDFAPLEGIVVTVNDLKGGIVYTATTDSTGVALFPRIFTREWHGARAMTFISATEGSPEILVDAPVKLLLPFLVGSDEEPIDGGG